MATESHNANPIIVEPAASSGSETPPTLLAPSHYTTSSSNSFDSSRPQSRGSSATSASESRSPATRNVESDELTSVRPPTPSETEPLPLNSTFSPDERPANRGISSTTAPSERAACSSNSNGTPWLSLCHPLFSRRRWLEHALGVFTLVASLVGLLFIGVRTYKLAVISTENSTLDSCTGLIQAGFTTLENSTPLCKMAMKNGPLSSPYHLGKRALHDTLALASGWIKGPPMQICGFLYLGCHSPEANITSRNISITAIIISTALTAVAFGGLTLIFARPNARSKEIFTSPARSDMQMTRLKDSGPTIFTGQGIVGRNPEDHQDLGQLRKRIRASQDRDSLMKETAPLQSTNSSSTTLVGGHSKSQVPIENSSSGEKHDGLIELQINGHTKAFLKLETCEFFRLTHRKRQHNDDSGSSSDSENPLSIAEEGFAQNGPGTSALAKGKIVKDKWIEELEREHQNWHNRHSHATQQAGDCLAGLVTNEFPTGKPQTI